MIFVCFVYLWHSAKGYDIACSSIPGVSPGCDNVRWYHSDGGILHMSIFPEVGAI
jgi:hypothetical protein